MMNDLTAARSQMAFSLGFHIVFSCIGMAMPFFMVYAHYMWLRKKVVMYKHVAQAWSRGVAIFFATGAVSGTVLSFELGQLWPQFMKHAGPIFGLPFSLEGAAFFIEAIAMGFYLYGWERLNPWFHWLTGLIVGISGVISGILVVSANSWMNSPSGFKFINGRYLDIDPIKAMFNDAWLSEAVHMTIAAFAATAFAVAGLHAYLKLRGKNVVFHSYAFRIAATFGLVSAIIQPISGDFSARGAASRQPAKLAAMEAHFKTGRQVPLVIGGLYDDKSHTLKGAIEVPGMLSLMVNGDVDSEVKGLDQMPARDRPPVAVLHYAFQIMVAMGMLMLLLSGISLFGLFKKQNGLDKKWFMRSWVIALPCGFIAVEAGWTVTEVGRQPWIIQGVMRTSDAVNRMPGIAYSFYLTAMIYLSLMVMVIFMLYRQIELLPDMGGDNTDISSLNPPIS